MMQPIEMLERIAEILAQVPDKIVFTGGATIALYLEEVAVPDIEDIVALLDGCPSLLTEIESAEGEVKEFLTSWFAANQEILAEVAPAFLSSAARNAGRGGMIRELLANLAGRR